jgi:hypothetical protein
MRSRSVLAGVFFLSAAYLGACTTGDGGGSTGTGGSGSGGMSTSGGSGGGGSGGSGSGGSGSGGMSTSGGSGGSGSGGMSASGGSGGGGTTGSGGTAGTAGGTTGAGGLAPATGGAGGAVGGTGGTNGLIDAGADSGVHVDGGDLFSVDYLLASQAPNASANTPGTIGIVTWSIAVAGITEAHIEFGLDTGYGMIAPVDLNEVDFRTLLLGMKPSKTYHFRIAAKVGSTTYLSDDYVIQTGPATTLVKLSSFRVVDEAARRRGFVVASYWSGSPGSGTNTAFIMDADGEIVWWYPSSVAGGIARARMSEDGKNMWMTISGLAGAPLSRVTMDTLGGQVYSNTVGSHDLTPVSGETMAYLDYSETDCDSIFEIDPGGTTKEVFESSSVLTGNNCHGNAVRYSKKEDVYTFSDLSQDVLVVNRSGGVEWRLSERVSGGNKTWGGAQHGHQLLDDSIIIFANSAGANRAAAMIEYSLDGIEMFRYDSGIATSNLGDVQRLPGGNTLVTYSTASVIHEVDSQGNLVLEITGASGVRIGYTLWRETLYGSPPDILY